MSTMRVLEMEEIESLVGSGRKKAVPQKSGSGIGGNNGGGIVAMVVGHRNFMTHVVFVAGVAILLLLFWSSKETPEPLHESDGVVTRKTPAPFHPADPLPAAAPIPVPDVGHPDNEMTLPDGNVPAPTPVMEAAPVEGDSETETVLAPVSSPVATPASAEDQGTNGIPDVNLYSKVATLPPLTGLSPPDEKTSKELAEKWGHWHFWDGDEEERPEEEYLSKYPNKDVPGDEFPEGAWQTDAVFVNHYLSDAGELVSRAIEAIYAEYGYPSEDMTPEQMVERSKTIFHWVWNDGVDTSKLPQEFQNKKESSKQAGWMPRNSLDGLIRRLLHAMMTSDTFTVALGGHSVAAGSGNIFQHNYAMQFHKVMAPVFARLGVKLVTRNLAQGGLSTLQGAMGMQSIYGDEIDVLLWDAGMTEGSDGITDFFVRQGLMGKKVPVILGNKLPMSVMTTMYNLGADVGQFYDSSGGIPATTSMEQAEEVPWAARYMSCSSEMNDYCKTLPNFPCKCWVENDQVTPLTAQKDTTSNNGNWHPGWRVHQLRGRNLAMFMLRALQEAIETWNEDVQGGPPLDDEFWHLTEYYESIRSQVLESTEGSLCSNYFEKKGMPSRICRTPMYGVTQFTPRKDPHLTSISAVAKPAPDGTRVENKLEQILPDDFEQPINPCQVIPEGEIDVFAIISGRRLESDTLSRRRDLQPPVLLGQNITRGSSHLRRLEEIVPGKGWGVNGEPIGICDGTFNSNCNQGASSECLLVNYNSFRGSVVGDGDSGWLVLEIGPVPNGLIILTLQPWVSGSKRRLAEERSYDVDIEGIRMLEGDFSVDTEQMRRDLGDKYAPKHHPDEMVFEYAINGKITTLPRDEFLEKMKRVDRTIYTLVVVDDPTFSSPSEKVEVAIRIGGCGSSCAIGLSHVYYG